MATADRLEREAKRKNPWPSIDKMLADQKAAQPVNLQPGEDFRGNKITKARDLDVAETKRELNKAANRANERQAEQAASTQDFYAYYAEENNYSPGAQFLEQSALISERESKLRKPDDILRFPEFAEAIETAREQGQDVSVEDINNTVDWRKLNLAADKIVRLSMENGAEEKNKVAIENVYKTLQQDDPMLAGLLPQVATEKLSELARDPSVMENVVGFALSALDTLLQPFIVANEAVMQSARAGLVQSQEAAQAGNGQLGVMGSMLGGFATNRDAVEKGDYNEDYIQSIREATDEEGQLLYSELEVDVAVDLSRLHATNPEATPWDLLEDPKYINNLEAKRILTSMIANNGPKVQQYEELLRQVDSAHLGNTGQVFFGAGVDEAYSEARGGETRQDVANIAGFTGSVLLDPTIFMSKAYRGVQGARYMLASLAPVASSGKGARTLLKKGPGFGPFRLNNKTYRFFDQLGKDLTKYEAAVKKADELPSGSDAQAGARMEADAMRARIARQYGQVPDETISDIFATVPRNADGKITADEIADYIDEANADYVAGYVALENEALAAGVAAHEIPRLVSFILDEQGIKSFDQALAGGAKLKRGDVAPQMTTLGVLRKSVANKIAAEVMPSNKALAIVQEFVDTTDAETVAQSMSDNAGEIGQAAQRYKRGTPEGFFDSSRRMFSSIAIDGVIDLTDPAASKTVYRYARAFLPQKLSETVANAWRNGDTGSRRLLLSAVVRAAATSRGLTVTKKQADAWMGKVEDIDLVTGRKTNEAYGQQVTEGTLPSRVLAEQQERAAREAAQKLPNDVVDGTPPPPVAVKLISEPEAPAIKTSGEAQDELFTRLGGTEDDLMEGRISWDEASRVEVEIMDEFRGQVLNDPETLDDFIVRHLNYGQGQADEVVDEDWWLQPTGIGDLGDLPPSMLDDVMPKAPARSVIARFENDGTISLADYRRIVDYWGEEKAQAWLITGHVDGYLDESLDLPVAAKLRVGKDGKPPKGGAAIPDEITLEYGVFAGKKNKVTRLAVPWAKGGKKNRKVEQTSVDDGEYAAFYDNLTDEIAAGYWDQQLDDYILANRTSRPREARWQPIPAREAVPNGGIREPIPAPLMDRDAPRSLSADAAGVESALHLDQTSRYVRVPNMAQMEELRREMGPLGKWMYAGHTGAEWYTNLWSIGTLFGWRFSIRNAIEELGLWFLTAGGVAELAKGRVASTARRRYSPDLYFKETTRNGKSELQVVWKPTLGPVNRLIEKGRNVATRGRRKKDKPTDLAAWQGEWAEAKGMPGYFMRNIFIPVVAPRVNKEAIESALVKYAQGDTEEWSRLVMEALVGYRLGGRSMASFGLVGDDDLEIIGHLLNSTHGLGLMDEVLQGGTFINSARNPSARSLATSLDSMDDLPPGVLLGTIDEERALAALKQLGDKVGVRLQGFKMSDVSNRRQLEDWHHLLRAVMQGDGIIGEEAVRGLYEISFGRASTIEVKQRVAAAIRADESGDYVARFSRLSSEEGVDQFASDYVEDVLALFQRQDGAINTRLLDRFFDAEGNYLGWGRPTSQLDGGFVMTDRVNAKDLAGIPAEERPAQLLLPNRQDKEYIPFAQSYPGIVDRAYAWMGRQNARLSREPVFLANMLTLWKASRNRRDQLANALLDARGANLEVASQAQLARAREQAGAIISKSVMDDAYELSLAFMDNPSNRSNLAWKARNFSRYYRASEDFYRRMRRMAIANPEGYAKAALVYSLVDDSGFVFKDDYGDKYFEYPLNGVAQALVSRAMAKVFANQLNTQFLESQPFTIGGKLLGLTPSADPMNMIPPVTSGWGQLPAAWGFGVVPEFAGARALVLGQFNQPSGNPLQDIINAFVPAGIQRVAALQDQELLQGQIADSKVKAVQVMSGNGMFDEVTIRDSKTGLVTKIPLNEATSLQIENSEEMRAANVFAQGLFVTKLVMSYALPAFPQVFQDNVTGFARGMNTDGLSDAYYDYMDKFAYDEEFVEYLEKAIDDNIYDPYGYAIGEWYLMKVNKIIDGDDVADGGSLTPFTVSSYEDDPDKPTQDRANMRATRDTLEWFHSDDGLQRYPDDLQGAALFLSPREGEWDANGHYILKNLLKTRIPKSDDDRLRQIANSEVAAQVGRVRYKYDKMRTELDPYSPTYYEDLKQINDSETAERDEIKAANPSTDFSIFEIDAGSAREAAEDVRRLIAWEREQAPDGKIAGTTVGHFASALMIFDDAAAELKQYPRNTKEHIAARNQIKLQRDQDYKTLMEIDPVVKNFVQSVVIPMGNG
jgi:hypothetical protein